jgi:hypothetical protein
MGSSDSRPVSINEPRAQFLAECKIVLRLRTLKLRTVSNLTEIFSSGHLRFSLPRSFFSSTWDPRSIAINSLTLSIVFCSLVCMVAFERSGYQSLFVPRDASSVHDMRQNLPVPGTLGQYNEFSKNYEPCDIVYCLPTNNTGSGFLICKQLVQAGWGRRRRR